MTYLETDALAISRSFDSMPEDAKLLASRWMKGYRDQQFELGEPLFPSQERALMERRDTLRSLYTGGLEAVPVEVSPWSQDPDFERATTANVQFLQSRYPDYHPDRHEYFLADYGLQKFQDPDLDDKAFYGAVQGVMKQEVKVEGMQKEAAQAAFAAAIGGKPMLTGMAEWQGVDQGPQTQDKLDMTPLFMRTYQDTAKRLQPYRELIKQAMDAAERNMTGSALSSDEAYLQGVEDVLKDVPEKDLQLVLYTMRLDAEKRGHINAEEKGTGYGRGAMQMLKGFSQLASPFNVGRQDPEAASFFQQTGESMYRLGKGALTDREGMEKRIEDIPESGSIRFSRGTIHNEEDARAYVEEVKEQARRVEALGSAGVGGSAGMGAAYILPEDTRLTFQADAAATRLIQEAKAREMKGLRIHFQLEHLAEVADPIPNVYASTLGSSGTALALTVATRGLALPMLAGAYKNLEFSDLSLKYPQMSRQDRAQIAWLSGGIQALGDGVGGGTLTKMPALKKLVTQPLTGRLVARALASAGGNYVVQNTVEGVQDIATPLLMGALKSDEPGYDWDTEFKLFWQGRADVAMGMIPLTLLGIGGSSVRDFHRAQDMLSQNDYLARAGVLEADRGRIVDLAQNGELEAAQAALQEGWGRRDPAVAAEYQALLPAQEAHAQQVFTEATRLGLIPKVIPQGDHFTVTDNRGTTAQFATRGEALEAAWHSMTPAQQTQVEAMLQQGETTLTTMDNVPAGSTLNYDAQGRLTGYTPPGQTAEIATSSATSTGRLVYSQPEDNSGGSQADQVASSQPRTPGQAMQALAENESRFRRGPASQSKDLGGIAKDYDLGDQVDFVDETTAFQDPAAHKVDQIHLKNGGSAYLFHGKDGSVWMDREEMRVSETDPAQGGDLVTQAFMTYAHNNGLRVRPDPLAVSDIARQRDLSHMLSSALRHRSTGHLMPNGINLKTGQAFENIPGWQEGGSREAYDHNVDLLARAEYEAVKAVMQTHGQTRLEDLQWDPVQDIIIHGPTGRGLSATSFNEIVSRLDPGGSGVGATTLSRALVSQAALQGHPFEGDGAGDHRPAQSDRGGANLDQPGTRLLRLLENRRLFYSQPGSADATRGPNLRSVLGSSEKLGQALAETARILNEKQPGLINEKTHLFTTVEELLASPYARQSGFTAEEIAKIRTAEGFHDRETGDSVVIAENTRLREGENVHKALTRVVMHERLSHDGLQLLLGDPQSVRARRWAALSAQIPQTELDAIAQEKAYEHLAGRRSDLAFEWLARRTETDTRLLEKGSLPQRMWAEFREMVLDLLTRLGIQTTLGRSFETQVQDLKIRARNAALRPVSRTAGTIDGTPEDNSGNLNADDWFMNMPVRGSFGGELYDMSQLDSLEKELAEHGVELVRNADAFLAERGIAGGFHAMGPGAARFYLKEHSTVREVLHEMIHFRQFRDLGYEGYMKLRKTGQHETQVWEWFLAHPDIMNRLNADEQQAEWRNYNNWKALKS